MPELPEVETTCRGIEPWVGGAAISDIVVRNSALRWPVHLPDELLGATVVAVQRRAKYILLRVSTDAHAPPLGTIIVHLGMSGSLRIMPAGSAPLKHDHVDLCFGDNVLRLNDPRRFGCILFQAGDTPEQHPLLADLGVEPLGNAFSGDYLFELSRGRRAAVKNFIMDGRIVVGVGNIYAAESLFMAGIRPGLAARRVTRAGYDGLAQAIRQVLQSAVTQGGTTLRDFVGSDGQPGYFRQSLYVYGRQDEPCRICGTTLKLKVLGQRSTVYCPTCQTSGPFLSLTQRGSIAK